MIAIMPASPTVAGVIPVLAKKRLAQESSRRHSQRLRTLLASLVFPVSKFWRDWAHFWRFLLSVFSFSGDREHLKKCFRTFFCMFGVLLGISCSGPGSYEEFVRAEDATGGVYEFVIPSEAKESGEAKEPSLRAMAPLGGKSAATYDLSFYTAPLDEPMQLEITWYSVEANQLNTNKLPETPLQPELSRRFCESADNQAVTLHAIRRETVWFPAGQHKALYRSGVRLEASAPVAMRVRPIDPPEDFRGLGIIIKRNDGTR